MDIIKKIFLLLSVIFFGALCALNYWNSHLYYRTEKIGKSEEKIEILERAVDYYPSNDLVFYELGRAYFELAASSLGDKDRSEEYLRKSIKSFQKSLRSNPASYFSHFNLAQSLLYLDYVFSSKNADSLAEFKKAAFLAGDNSQIFFEVSKIFLSQWSRLSDKNKNFTLEILKKIAASKDEERILSLLYVWEMNVRDYSIIEMIMPEDPRIYRLYADFLGEKSLSSKVRKRSLTKAEFLEFGRAKEEYKEGEQRLYSFQMEEAFGHFASCLNILERIRFYQNLASQNQIDSSEFINLKKSALLNLAKCVIEQKRALKEVEGYLSDYLSLEEEEEAVEELESYLRRRGLIREKMEINFSNNLDQLYFELLLHFHQNRHRDIMQLGRHLMQSFIVIPEDKRNVYVRILNLIGDSYQKINHVYDAGAFYQKAFEIDSDNLETLINLRRNYEILNADEKIHRIGEKIDEILSPREKLFENHFIEKNSEFSTSLVLDGGKITLDLHFAFGERNILPLISVFFNGCVVWEDYLDKEFLSLSLHSKVGENSLRLVPLNKDISVIRIAYH